MDKIIQSAGRLLYRFDIKLRRIFHSQILRNHTSVISFILLICFTVIITVVWILGFSTPIIIILSSSIIFGMFLLLLLIGSWKEAKKLKQEQLSYVLQFNRSNLNGILLSELGFSENNREDLCMVLNNLRPSKKIDFRLVSDNRIAADYKKLFRILHLLTDEGIKDFKKERKEMLFKFIESTFTMNGSEVNRASLNTRFSEFVNESETEFDAKGQEFKGILR